MYQYIENRIYIRAQATPRVVLNHCYNEPHPTGSPKRLTGGVSYRLNRLRLDGHERLVGNESLIHPACYVRVGEHEYTDLGGGNSAVHNPSCIARHSPNCGRKAVRNANLTPTCDE